MFDAVKIFSHNSQLSQETKGTLGIFPEECNYLVATFHRQENTNSSEKLRELISAVRKLAEEIQVVLPMHPRLRKSVADLGLLDDEVPGLRIIQPVSYLEMLHLQKHAQVILTDSGGIQKEAFYLERPCVTVRDETEWTETVDLGWNRLVESEANTIVSSTLDAIHSQGNAGAPYGDGNAASKIVEQLLAGSWKNHFSGS
jgi:UDP-GlcNAc3NAcA epimerase